MREILFRGKTISGFWAEGLLSRIRDDWYISNSADKPYAYHVRPETVGQFTGLIDKNGTKIFEHDVLACKTEAGSFTDQVVYLDDIASFSGEKYGTHIMSSFAPPFGLTVIGNIFDNEKQKV